MYKPVVFLTFSLRSRLKQRRRNGLFTLLSHDFQQMFEQIFSVRVKTLSDTDLVASRRLKREKGSLPVDRSTCVAQKRRRSNSPIFPFVPRSRPRSLRESQLVSLSLSFLKWRMLLNIILTFISSQAILVVTNSSHCDPRVSKIRRVREQGNFVITMSTMFSVIKEALPNISCVCSVSLLLLWCRHDPYLFSPVLEL